MVDRISRIFEFTTDRSTLVVRLKCHECNQWKSDKNVIIEERQDVRFAMCLLCNEAFI